MSTPVSQSVCRICGDTARPGSAVVLEFGAGGRVHKECLAIARRPVPIDDVRAVDPIPFPSFSLAGNGERLL